MQAIPAFVGLLIALAAAAASGATPPPARIARPDGVPSIGPGCFGAAVAISGRHAFVGDPCDGPGVVYRLRRRGSSWHVDARLDTSHPAPQGNFGAALALNGSWLAIGAPGEGEGGVIYEVANALGAAPGIPQYRAPSIISPQARFGASIAPVRTSQSGLYGKFLGGAPQAACASGEAQRGTIASYEVFWNVCSPARSGYPSFGAAMASHGNLVLVGAPGSTIQPPGLAGAGYLYDHAVLFAIPPTLVSVFVPSDPNPLRRFASSTAMNGSTIVFGAPLQSGPGSPEGGNVWVYRGTIPNWQLMAVLAEPLAEPAAEFGTSVALGANTLVIGSPTSYDGGAIYEYTEAPGGWLLTGMHATTKEDADGRLGSSVAIDGTTWIAGAPSIAGQGGNGAVYISMFDYLLEADFDEQDGQLAVSAASSNPLN